MEKKSILYKIINIKNRHWYVGSSNSMNRKNVHFCELRNNRHTNSRLQNAWNLYGSDNFKFKVLCKYSDRLSASNAEDMILNKHVGKQYCYNLSKDAYGYTIGPLKQETKDKISQSLIGRPSKRKGLKESIELRQNRCRSIQKVMDSLTDEDKKKFGNKRIKSIEERRKISNSLTGRKHSDERLINIRKAASSLTSREKKRLFWENLKNDPIKKEKWLSDKHAAAIKGWIKRKHNQASTNSSK